VLGYQRPSLRDYRVAEWAAASLRDYKSLGKRDYKPPGSNLLNGAL
jgi:hypothetical protein